VIHAGEPDARAADADRAGESAGLGRADVAIVGAGAAGLATAIFAAEGLDPRRHRLVLLDGAARPGAKILVSGGGRCNVTHDVVRPDDFHGDRVFVRKVLAAFDERRTVGWFASLGVELVREETGKLFPVSGRARTVLEALLARAEALGVEIRPDHRVLAVSREEVGFRIGSSRGDLLAARLVLATGGRSLPRSGSDGAGYALARSLGHSVTPTWPALVPLLLAEGFPHAELSGVAHPVRLTVRSGGGGGEKLDERTGDLLWTHFGISGPVAMDTSRSWVRPAELGLAPRLIAHLVPDRTREELEELFLAEGRRAPRRTVASYLADLLPKRVGAMVARRAGVDPSRELPQVTKAERRALLAALTELELPVEGPRGWNQAEVTAGGVPLGEVDPRTMESKLVPSLHLVGEILDVDGRIGGFNFQWAWSGGWVAGRSIAKALGDPDRARPAGLTDSSG